ncbi:Protein LNK3 [Hirschfeldia incana]|nr:Protein LNK3 [Hirschfeldia incana]
MDCYTGMKFEELIVPNYQELSSETYPSNGMWGGWNMNSPEAAEKCFGYDGFNGQMGMRTSEEEEEEEASEISKALYGASSLHDFEGIEQMDDIFLSSILEDVPGSDGDVHLASSSNNSVGSSSMYSGRDVHMFHCHDMPLKEEAPFTISDLSEENMLDSQYVDELSSEELVLQDLQKASEKLTDETRKCFRDTFYRLARNSQEKFNTNTEEFYTQASRYAYGDNTSYLIAG